MRASQFCSILVAACAACSVQSSAIVPPGLDDAAIDAPDVDAPPIVPAPWWVPEYRKRRVIVITARGVGLPADASIQFAADTRALIAAGDLREDGNDWRIVRHGDGMPVELDRWVDDVEGGGWAGNDTRTWFRLTEDIARQTADTRTYVYYGRDDESAEAPADMNEVFFFGDDFEDGLGKWTPNGHGEMPTVSATDARGGASALELFTGMEVQGGLHRDQDLPGGALSFSLYIRRVDPGAVAYVRTFSVPYADLEQNWNGPDIRAHSHFSRDESMQFIRYEPWGVTTWAEEVDDGWHHVEVVWDQTMDVVAGSLDGGGLSTFFRDYGEPGRPARAFAIEGDDEDGGVRIDNYVIRRHLDLPPTVTLGDVEDRP